MWGEANQRECWPDDAALADWDEPGIVPPSEPRGADDFDSDSDGSLEDANQFANMEALMAELDEVAMSSVTQR